MHSPSVPAPGTEARSPGMPRMWCEMHTLSDFSNSHRRGGRLTHSPKTDGQNAHKENLRRDWWALRTSCRRTFPTKSENSPFATVFVRSHRMLLTNRARFLTSGYRPNPWSTRQRGACSCCTVRRSHLPRRRSDTRPPTSIVVWAVWSSEH